MRKDSANSDEIPIFATSRPSLQCMKCLCKKHTATDQQVLSNIQSV